MSAERRFSQHPQARPVEGNTILPKYRKEQNDKKLKRKKTSLHVFLAGVVLAGSYAIHSFLNADKNVDYQSNPRTILVNNDFSAIIDHNQVANIKDTCQYKAGETLIVRDHSQAFHEGTNRQETVFFVDGLDCDAWSFREDLMKNTNFSD